MRYVRHIIALIVLFLLSTVIDTLYGPGSFILYTYPLFILLYVYLIIKKKIGMLSKTNFVGIVVFVLILVLSQATTSVTYRQFNKGKIDTIFSSIEQIEIYYKEKAKLPDKIDEEKNVDIGYKIFPEKGKFVVEKTIGACRYIYLGAIDQLPTNSQEIKILEKCPLNTGYISKIN